MTARNRRSETWESVHPSLRYSLFCSFSTILICTWACYLACLGFVILAGFEFGIGVIPMKVKLQGTKMSTRITEVLNLKMILSVGFQFNSLYEPGV